MTQSRQATMPFRRRFRGYDRGAVDETLASTRDELRIASEQRDELLASAANVQRIGDQVAIMLRALADHAAEVEQEAATSAARVLQEAQAQADQMRADAAAVLAAAELQAQEVLQAALEDSQRRAATVIDRREVTVASLRVAIDQMRWLTESIEELDIEAPEGSVTPHPLTLVIDGHQVADPDASEDPSAPGFSADGGGDEDRPNPCPERDDAVASALAALNSWTP
ncbi:MAG TPA: hypothetical protein VGA36_06080 [Nitriliruptorales bacterium]